MSGRGYASGATRQTVLQAVERLGYRPSASARGLRTARTATLGVLVANLANPVFLPFLRGVEHVAEAHGYAVLIADSRRSRDVERHELDTLYAHRVEALIVGESVENPEHLATLSEAGLRVVRAPDAGGESTAWSAAAIEAPAIVAACTRLADLGHRRVAYVTGPATRPPAPRGSARRDLVVQTLTVRGVAVEPVTMRGTDDPDRVTSAIRELLDTPRPPTALLCAAHPLAPRLLRALADADVALPERVSFLTFGDSPWAAAYRPAIAVIRRDAYTEGRAVAQRVLYDLGAAPEPGSADPPLATFDPRQSMATPPAAAPR
jgi:LacI family transcriptional regulator